MRRTYVLNGPNLNRLGTREPEIYGHTTFADLVTACTDLGRDLGLDVVVLQPNHEGELVGWLHRAQDEGAVSCSIQRPSLTTPTPCTMRAPW